MEDQELLDDFIEALEAVGSPAANALLRETLGWPQARYEAVKTELAARKIVPQVGAEPGERSAATLYLESCRLSIPSISTTRRLDGAGESFRGSVFTARA